VGECGLGPSGSEQGPVAGCCEGGDNSTGFRFLFSTEYYVINAGR
jgi:hypothetical protein